MSVYDVLLSFDGDRWEIGVGMGVGATYSVVCERHEALAYPLLCVDVADCDVQCDEEHETQEDGPLDDEALLSQTVNSSWSL